MINAIAIQRPLSNLSDIIANRISKIIPIVELIANTALTKYNAFFNFFPTFFLLDLNKPAFVDIVVLFFLLLLNVQKLVDKISLTFSSDFDRFSYYDFIPLLLNGFFYSK